MKKTDKPQQKSAAAKSANRSTPQIAPSTPTCERVGRGRRLRQWAGRIFIITIVLVVLFRISLVWIIPAVISRAAGHYGLAASVERVELNVLGTDAGLWHLKLSPIEGGPELASIDYVRAKVATWALLTGKLHIRRVEAEGVELQLHRNADGRLPLFDRVLASLPESRKKQQQQSTLSLSPPLQVDAMRLSNLKIVFFDEFADPSIQSDVNLNLTLSDLDSTTRPTRFALELRADPILNFLHIEGTAHTSPDELKADLNIRLQGLHPHTIDGYLKLAGLNPIAKQIDAGMSGKAHITIIYPAAVAAVATTSQPGTQPAAQPTTAPFTQPAVASASQISPPSAAVQGIIALHNITLTADGEPAAALDQLTLNISTLDGNWANCAALSIQGVRARASRATNGRLRVAGLELDNSPSTPSATTQPTLPPLSNQRTAITNKLSPAAAPTSTEPQFRWRLGDLDLQGVALSFRDELVRPVVDLSLRLDRLTLRDPSGQAFGVNTSVLIAGQGSAPGVVGAFEINGEFRPFQTPLDLRTSLRAHKVRPDAIEPYLKILKLESLLEDASLSLNLQADWTPLDDGGLRGNLVVSDVSFSQNQPLLELEKLAITQWLINPKAENFSVGSVLLQGTKVSALREPSGNLQLLGFRTTGRGARTADTEATQEAIQETEQVEQTEASSSNTQPQPLSLEPLDILATLPHMRVGSLAWKDIDVTWHDQMVSPAITTHVSDAGLAFENFVFDPKASSLSGEPAKFRVWISAPEVFGKLELQGDVLAGGRGLSLRYGVLAESLQSKVLSPYLVPYGFEPLLENGRLTLTGQVQAVRGPEYWQLGATIDQLEMTDGDAQLGNIGKLQLVDFSLDQGTLGLGLLQIDQPKLQAKRTSDGSLVLLGIKIHPGAELPPPAKDAIAELMQQFTRVQASIKTMKVNGATLDWQDEFTVPVAALQANVQLTVTDVDLGHEHASGIAEATLQVPGVVDQLKVTTRLSLADKSPAVAVAVRGSGLTPAGAIAYLPTGLDLPWKEGEFKADITARLNAHDEGGHGLRFTVSDMDLREKNKQDPMVALKSAVLEVSRYDPAGGVIQFANISSAGFETSIHRASNGTLTLGGLTLGAAPDQANTDAVTEPVATSSQPASETIAIVQAPATAEVPQAPEKTEAQIAKDLSVILAQRRQTAPLISVMNIDLQAASVTITDDMRPTSAPLIIKDFRLVNDGSIEVLGPASAQTPPVKLKLRFEPSPIAREVQVDLITRPFDEQAKMGMAVQVSGINGEGLLAVLPELAESIKADDLVDSYFKTRLGVSAKLNRVRPWEIDFAKGGVFNLGMMDLEFRQIPNGMLFGGVKSVRIETVNVSPAWKNIRIENVDITQIAFNGWRDGDGLHMLGLTLPISKTQDVTISQGPTTAPATATQPAADAQAQNTVASAPVPPAPVPPGVEVTLNRLTISGLDGRFEDRMVTPVMVLPLTGLDMDARNLSNSPQTQTRAMRFNMLMTAGKVEVPVREQGLSVTGVLGDTAKLLTGRKTKTGKVRMVERDLFSQVAASGRVRFNPTPDGWVKLSINGLDLWPLRGTASEVGVVVGSGVLDLTVDGRFAKNGDLNTRSRIVLTDLSLSEPPNGFISRYLALPAPLDAVIMAVKATDGSITLPINVTVKERQISQAQITGQAVSAIGSVITKAFTSSPMKLAEGVTSFVGVGALKGLTGKAAKLYEPVVIEYLAGQAVPELPFTKAVDDLIKRMASDSKLNVVMRSQISMADVEMASLRANPTREECMQLIAEHSQRARELSYLRADMAGQAKAQLASMAPKQADVTLAKLRLLDQELVRTNEALDGVYELLRPGSQRQSMRRTRNAAIAIGQARLEYIAIKLFESNISNALERVQITPAQYNPIEPTVEQSAEQPTEQPSVEVVEPKVVPENGPADQHVDPKSTSLADQSIVPVASNNPQDPTPEQAPISELPGQVVITLIPTR